MPSKRILVLIIVIIVVVLAYAWIDGGEESLRPIAQPVTAPLEQTARMPEPA